MNLSREEIEEKFKVWLQAWDSYDLDGVMNFMHEEVIFENWDGKVLEGKNKLRKAWVLWFLNHGNFKFVFEDMFIDVEQQKLLFRWRLEWPSLEVNYKGKPETRRGVDVIHLADGMIKDKYSYSKTILQINKEEVILQAVQSNFFQRS